MSQENPAPALTIAHIARACYPFHPFGGLEQHVYHLTLELARLGHNVTLFTAPPTTAETVKDPTWHDHVKHIPISYQTVGVFRRNSIPDRLLNYPLFAERVATRIRKMSPQPQIVHAHGLAGFGYAHQNSAGVPLILNPHGMEEFKNESFAKQVAYAPFRAGVRFAAHKAAAVIATDAALLPEVERFLKVEPTKIALVPNAVALDEIEKLVAKSAPGEVERKLSLQGKFVILSVGRLESNKGFHILLNALAQVRSQLKEIQPEWRALIVGTGSQFEFLKQEIARHNLGERVKLVGSLENPLLHALYERANLFVHPTLYEGSSLVTLEAMAHRKPILATRTGGLPDKVFESGENENGRLVPPYDTSALGTKLLELAALSPNARFRLSQNSRRLVENRFSWTAAAKKYVELYQNLLNVSQPQQN